MHPIPGSTPACTRLTPRSSSPPATLAEGASRLTYSNDPHARRDTPQRQVHQSGTWAPVERTDFICAGWLLLAERSQTFESGTTTTSYRVYAWGSKYQDMEAGSLLYFGYRQDSTKYGGPSSASSYYGPLITINTNSIPAWDLMQIIAAQGSLKIRIDGNTVWFRPLIGDCLSK